MYQYFDKKLCSDDGLYFYGIEKYLQNFYFFLNNFISSVKIGLTPMNYARRTLPDFVISRSVLSSPNFHRLYV